jgi:hypothetical protein
MSARPDQDRRVQKPFRILSFALFLLIAATGLSMPFKDAEQLQVGQAGLKLYPRWNKAFTPVAELKQGETLTILRTRGSWREVRAESLGKQGWIYCAIEKESDPGGSMKLSIAASPTTSGLVAKGWSATEYAKKNGTDLDAVQKLMQRTLEMDGHEEFLREGGLKR